MRDMTKIIKNTYNRIYLCLRKKSKQMKKTIIVFITAVSSAFLIACGDNNSNINTETATTETPKETSGSAPSYDPNRGEGKFNTDNVTLGASLDDAMATKGGAIANTKCIACHKMTGEKLVGPGWLGVTQRRTPYWIMNFITNPDPMIDKDPAVQALLELCMVRMPNQNLEDKDAREILEFMRKNDGVK